MAREYFCAYHSYIEAMEKLSDAECGRLFRACLKYSKTGEAQDLSGNERFIFPGLKSQIDRDKEKYDNICKTNQYNGSKGGQANASGRYQALPSASKRPPNVPQREGKEEDKDNDYNPPLPPKGEHMRFDEFWAAYPKKTGKDAARKAYARRKPTKELHTRMLSAIAAQKQGEQWKKDGGQYIPNPSTWLNQGRWEDEVPKPIPAYPAYKKTSDYYSQRQYSPEELAEKERRAMEAEMAEIRADAERMTAAGGI